MSISITGTVTNGVVVPSSPLPEGAKVEAKTAFEKLKGLAGEWTGKGDKDHPAAKIVYRLISNGSAPTSDVIWLASYGALSFVLGLVLLRKGSLAD